jgi:hypothetical protein
MIRALAWVGAQEMAGGHPPFLPPARRRFATGIVLQRAKGLAGRDENGFNVLANLAGAGSGPRGSRSRSQIQGQRFRRQ